ncbi:hypothetical protein I316_02206 [Kwoniella heveanensis BCC8398]|uniref:FYVE-type domain-containing protein n=1 Tax=Kwoniella heveanensis BCC8398 TaxID=1296120 RepID=A0A1B9GZ74_9TREE|nr:hypothetical protein I316_02206 [Kwoniella heveanensis BCC8398]
MSHSSSHSSLLQLNRPDSLLPQLPTSNEVAQQQAQAQWLEQHEHTQQQLCRSKGSGSDLRLAASQQDLTSASGSASASGSSSSPPKSQTSSQSNSQFSRMLGSAVYLQPIASSSSGLNYLNMEPTSSPSCEYAHAALPSPLAEAPDNRQQCAKLLASACVGVMGEALDKAKWQPDEDSALCTYPLCTANFAQPTYFFLGPRRHHCRMCGQLFCASHSAQRGALVQIDGQGKRRVVKERVCDLCCQKTDPADIELPRSTQHSRRNSSATDSDQHSDLVTPLSEDGQLLSGSALLRAQSRVNLALDKESAISEAAELAPIAEWMDRSGVLSLYPLAVNPSHARSRRSLSPAPSAGPLFAPSISARREAKEKELERLTLRQRRMGAESDFWLPGKWGYKREDFDPTFLKEGEDDGEDFERSVGGVVEDGPIRFRMGSRKVTTPGAISVRG